MRVALGLGGRIVDECAEPYVVLVYEVSCDSESAPDSIPFGLPYIHQVFFDAMQTRRQRLEFHGSIEFDCGAISVRFLGAR